MNPTYVLLKELPGSNRGDHFTWNNSSNKYYKNGNVQETFFEKEHVENNPEWFKKEPHFSMLEELHKMARGNQPPKKNWEIYAVYIDKIPYYVGSVAGLQKEVEQPNNNLPIYQVRRLSDNVIFTVGDIIDGLPIKKIIAQEDRIHVRLSLNDQTKWRLLEDLDANNAWLSEKERLDKEKKFYEKLTESHLGFLGVANLKTDKEYEVLSFKNTGDSIPHLYTKVEGEDAYRWIEWNTGPVTKDVLLQQGYVIHSVKRLTDNTIWTVNDEVNFYRKYGKLNTGFKIAKFIVLGDASIEVLLNVEFDGPHCRLSELRKPEPKPVLFTTTDGKEIREGDKWWFLNKNNHVICGPEIAASEKNFLFIVPSSFGWYFSSEEAAKKYQHEKIIETQISKQPPLNYIPTKRQKLVKERDYLREIQSDPTKFFDGYERLQELNNILWSNPGSPHRTLHSQRKWK